LNGVVSGNGYAARVRGDAGSSRIEACKSSTHGVSSPTPLTTHTKFTPNLLAAPIFIFG
jgi:hypothetical protein